MNLNVERIGSNFIPLPPEDQQIQLIEQLEEKLIKFDASVVQMENQIQKLQEFKATLINSAVTGKIKV